MKKYLVIFFILLISLFSIIQASPVDAVAFQVHSFTDLSPLEFNASPGPTSFTFNNNSSELLTWTDFHIENAGGPNVTLGFDLDTYFGPGTASLSSNSLGPILNLFGFSIASDSGFPDDSLRFSITLTDVSNVNGGSAILSARPTTNAVPEPSTLLLLGSGLVGLVGFGRNRLKI